VIYLDASVLLAELLAEDRRPPASIWQQPLIASRLIEYEVWVRLHGRGRATSHGEAADELLARISMVELAPTVLKRALEPFPVPLRLREALHLASIDFLLQRRLAIRLATYDQHMAVAAAAVLRIPIVNLS
jgi:PIN domain